MTQSTELTVVERAALALGADEGEKQLIALAQKYADITDIKNPAGRTQCHAAAMELGNARIAVDKTGKAAREDANAFQKAVIAEVARRVAIVKPEEDRLLAIRDAWDAEREAEKAAKAAAEKVRVDAIRKRIAEMQAIPAMLVGKQSATIATAVEGLEAVEITLESFAEFAGEAEMAKIATVAKLGEMLSAQVAHEEEAKRLQAEREQLARERAEAAERERVATEERAAQEAKRLAEAARIDAEQRAARQAEEVRLRAEREAHEAELRRQREAEEARLRAEREAEQRRLDEQRAEIAKQQAEIAAAKAEAERIERERLAAIEAEARAKREAEEKAARAEAERIRAEQDAAIAEQKRREQEQFAANGPGDVEIVKFLADQYDVEIGDVMDWMKKFDYAAADEHFAAANVAANQLEKAA